MIKNLSYLAIANETGYRGDARDPFYPVYLDSENLSLGKEFKAKTQQLRDSRSVLIESLQDGPQKPGGQFKFQPRGYEFPLIMRSHFQCGSQLGDIGTKFGFVPINGTVGYTEAGAAQNSTYDYGQSAGLPWSISILKRYFDTDQNSGTNAILFKHGICTDLTLELASDGDLTAIAEYKFRDVVNGTKITSVPGDTNYGTYYNRRPFQWVDGTVTVGGASLELKKIKIHSSNSNVERSHIGRQNPDTFAFKDFEVSGDFTINFPEDGILMVGSMIARSPFSIYCNAYIDSENYVTIDLPNCIRESFTPPIGNLEVSIPFKAYGTSVSGVGTSPITITCAFGDVPTDIYYDAWNGDRSGAGVFDYADAGDGARVGDYTYADRDA